MGAARIGRQADQVPLTAGICEIPRLRASLKLLDYTVGTRFGIILTFTP